MYIFSFNIFLNSGQILQIAPLIFCESTNSLPYNVAAVSILWNLVKNMEILDCVA